MQGKTPLILDFDASVLSLDRDARRIPLGAWQETIRFGCSWADFSRLEDFLCEALPDDYGCVFTGSGDFHHLSLFLLRKIIQKTPIGEPGLDVVVCDNHPDNMRYLFGLHCGSWVSHAAALDGVRHVHVLGICSPDITLPRAWENRLTPFLRRKLTYWNVNRRADWLGLIGRKEYGRNFASADDLIEAVLPVLGAASRIYLSVDKDVLAPEVARTNWDQGVFTEAHLQTLVAACRDKIIGTDVCGDVSKYTYSGRFKRLLSRLDGQEPLAAEQAQAWQKGQRDMNIRLLDWLDAAAPAS